MGNEPNALKVASKVALLATTTVLFASGCAGPTLWNLNGRTQADLNQHHLECQNFAGQAINEQNLNQSGQFIGSGSRKAANAGVAMILLEGAGFNQRYESCMISQGYSVYVPGKSTSAPAMDGKMECQTDNDCTTGSSCRSKRGGGTQCRATGP